MALFNPRSGRHELSVVRAARGLHDSCEPPCKLEVGFDHRQPETAW